MLPGCSYAANKLPQTRLTLLFPGSAPPTPSPQALSHALRVGSPDRLRLYRLYCAGTLEERLLQLSDRLRSLDALCQQSHGRCAASGKGWWRWTGWRKGQLAGWKEEAACWLQAAALLANHNHTTLPHEP